MMKYLLILLLIILFCGSGNAAVCNCTNCTDCTAKLNNVSCTTVLLNQMITDEPGTCITWPASNKIFDCQGNTIDGVTSGTGIYLNGKNNNTIRNCIVNEFYRGIYIYNSDYNFVDNNTANLNNFGIDLRGGSDYNNITNCGINGSDDDGLYLDASTHNRLINNTINNTDEDALDLYTSSDYNVLENNVITNTGWDGIYIFDSDNNNLTNNSIRDGGVNGFAINSGSTGNILNSNTACGHLSPYVDIKDQDSNTGDNNTCDTPSSWNDTGTIGCTYTCTTTTDGNCYCSSCDDCEERLNDNLCSNETRLDTDIENITKTCIDSPENFVNKTFNAQLHHIYMGTHRPGWNKINLKGIAINDLVGSKVVNAIISGFGIGIWVNNSDEISIGNSTISFSRGGNLELHNVTMFAAVNLTLYNGSVGIYANSSAPRSGENVHGNTITCHTKAGCMLLQSLQYFYDNTICNNTVDINNTVTSHYITENNTCDSTINYNDTGTTGCNYFCTTGGYYYFDGICTDFDYICDTRIAQYRVRFTTKCGIPYFSVTQDEHILHPNNSMEFNGTCEPHGIRMIGFEGGRFPYWMLIAFMAFGFPVLMHILLQRRKGRR